MFIPTSLVILVLAELTPTALILCVVFGYRWWIERRKERIPISEKLLRPAGESLRIRIGLLEEELGFTFAYAVVPPLIAVAIIQVIPENAKLGRLIFLLPSFGIFVWMCVRIVRIGSEIRNHTLGFHGERATGEELNQLMLDGCRVFHDVPMEPYGNIDHVIVARSGVYAIETKTKRKRNLPSGGNQREHEVIYDGKALHFPRSSDVRALDQARQQAERLQVMLTKAVGDPIGVAPILTLPGWFVTTRVKTELKVLNPKMIRQVIASNPPSLSLQLFERTVYQLDQRCRDVVI